MTPHPIPPKLFSLPQICHSRKRAVKVLRSTRRQMCSQGSRRGYWVRKNFPEATEEKREILPESRSRGGQMHCPRTYPTVGKRLCNPCPSGFSDCQVFAILVTARCLPFFPE